MYGPNEVGTNNSKIDMIDPTFHVSTMVFILKIAAITRNIPISYEKDIFHNYLEFFCRLPVSGYNLSVWNTEMRQKRKMSIFRCTVAATF